jgi:hypothetical protein
MKKNVQDSEANPAAPDVSTCSENGVTVRLCKICELPLVGRQRDYCGAACKQVAHRRSSLSYQRLLMLERLERAEHRLRQENTQTFRLHRYDGSSAQGVPRKREIRLFHPRADEILYGEKI